MFDVQGGGFSWLFPFENGAPPIGWHDAICYLVLPVALVVSQFITQKILQPPSQDESAQQTNAILKFLPLMIGEQHCTHMHAVLQAMWYDVTFDSFLSPSCCKPCKTHLQQLASACPGLTHSICAASVLKRSF